MVVSGAGLRPDFTARLTLGDLGQEETAKALLLRPAPPGSPHLWRLLREGTYTVRISAPGHADATKVVRVDRGGGFDRVEFRPRPGQAAVPTLVLASLSTSAFLLVLLCFMWRKRKSRSGRRGPRRGSRRGGGRQHDRLPYTFSPLNTSAAKAAEYYDDDRGRGDGDSDTDDEDLTLLADGSATFRKNASSSASNNANVSKPFRDLPSSTSSEDENEELTTSTGDNHNKRLLPL